MKTTSHDRFPHCHFDREDLIGWLISAVCWFLAGGIAMAVLRAV